MISSSENIAVPLYTPLYFLPLLHCILHRVATGENWPNIMLACTAKAQCDRKLLAVEPEMEYCGNDIAYLYFLSFVFFCSFLVSTLNI